MRKRDSEIMIFDERAKCFFIQAGLKRNNGCSEKVYMSFAYTFYLGAYPNCWDMKEVGEILPDEIKTKKQKED